MLTYKNICRAVTLVVLTALPLQATPQKKLLLELNRNESTKRAIAGFGKIVETNKTTNNFNQTGLELVFKNLVPTLTILTNHEKNDNLKTLITTYMGLIKDDLPAEEKNLTTADLCKLTVLAS